MKKYFSLIVLFFLWFTSVNGQTKADTSSVQKPPSLELDSIPKFIGRNGTGLSEFIMENLVYPVKLAKKNKEARVVVDFTVDVDGSVRNVICSDSSIYKEFNMEAIRVIKLTNRKWRSAVKNGKAVKMRMRIPINFDIEE